MEFVLSFSDSAIEYAWIRRSFHALFRNRLSVRPLRVQTVAESKQRNRQLYERLHVAEEDLRQAHFFAGYLLKKGWHHEPWERRGTIYMRQSAFTTAMVVAYSRPFTQSRGWPKLPEKLRSGFNTEQRALHKRVLVLRDLVYAHTDVATRAVRPFSIDGYPTAIEAMPPMRVTHDEASNLQAMIAIVQAAIRARKQVLIKAIE